MSTAQSNQNKSDCGKHTNPENEYSTNHYQNEYSIAKKKKKKVRQPKKLIEEHLVENALSVTQEL